jgi:two-component system response regulator RegA
LRHFALSAACVRDASVDRRVRRRRLIRNVLVVDDDPMLLSAWKRMIVRERKTAGTASDTQTALELAAAQTFDLAIVDLRLGRSSGLDVISELRRAHPEMLIALCSGYLSVDTAVAGVHAGADVVVFKPLTFREVLHKLAEDEPPDLDETPTLARAEWEHIMRVLADCDGNVSMAARRLGVYRSSLQRRLKKFAPRK